MLNKGLKSKPLFLFHFFEWRMLKKADYITVPFNEMKSQFYKKFRSKIIVIPQGVKLGTSVADYRRKDVIRIGFSGYIYYGIRDIFPLIEYLLSKKYNFEFHVFTNQRDLFKKYKAYLNKNIFIYDYIDRNSLIYSLSELDFLVAVNFDSVDGVITAIPSKLIDYGETRRPILFYENSELPIEIIDEFMTFNFSRAFNIDLNKYNISVVTDQFVKLIKRQ